MNKQDPTNGPVYAIYHRDDVHLFDKVESSQFCGVDCIKGKALRVSKNDWREGLIIHLPTSGIIRIIEYPSLDDYKKVIANHYAKKAET